MFPIVLIFGRIIFESPGIKDSISDYYYSVMRDVFVGSLWAIAIFLICYQYDYLDNIVSNIAGFCAIGLSLFPVTPEGITATQQQEIIGKAHFGFATGFLIALAIMAFLFTRENPRKDKVPDRKRKWLYRICGITMFACIGLAALILLVPNLSGKWQHQIHPILWIETFASWAFGIAWFVKGETLHRARAAIQRLPLTSHAES
jgi:biotin transporter BioY